MAAIINNLVVSSFTHIFAARIVVAQPTASMWEFFVKNLAEEDEGVAHALKGMSKPGRTGWKARRQAALLEAIVAAQYGKALWRGRALAERMGLEPKDETAYAQRWVQVWAENVFDQGAEALADSKALVVLENRQTQGWIAKVDAGMPVVADGLALLGLTVAYAAWLGLGEAGTEEFFYYTGLSRKSCDLRDTRVFVGAERRIVGNWLASPKTLCQLWAGMATVMGRNGVFETAAEEVASKGWGLKDVNPNFNSCGHYPEWKVVVGGPFKTHAQAQAEAAKKNAASDAAWQAFLNA